MLKDQYICRRAANAILSEIGPYQISSDALQTVNQFLDQILALLLHHTKSVEPALVKTHLLQLLPFSLGKNALVEAEMEVKSFNDTNNTYYPLYGETNEPIPFFFDQVWTSLRYRCMERSTLTETPPDAMTKTSNNDGGLQGMTFSPMVIIYFTAILEHIAEYILTIIAITAEHEGVRYIRIKEVYSALMNDGQVGGLFKQTDLQLKLEKRVLSYQSQQQPPYQVTNLPSSLPSPVASFKNQVSVSGNTGYQVPDLGYDHYHDDDIYSEPASSTDSRTSSSIKSGQSSSDYRPVSVFSNVTSTSNRSSSSSSKRTFRFFGKKDKRPSTPSSGAHLPQEQRTKSPPPPPSSHPPLLHDSNAPALDFEDLMRSGNTIKVSLTPNRLRSIEVKSSPTYPQQHHQTKKTGLFSSSSPVSPSSPSSPSSPLTPSTPISSPTLSHPTPLRVFPPNGTPFENPRAAPKPPIGYYQTKSFETPPLTPDSSIASRLSTTRSTSPSFEDDQQQTPPPPPPPPPQQQQRTANSNARHVKQVSLAPLQLSGRSQYRPGHRKQESVDTLSTDVCAMDLPSPPSTMDHHPSSTIFSNNALILGNDVQMPNKTTYNRPSSMVAKRAASGMARPASCHENFALSMEQQQQQQHLFQNCPTMPDIRATSPPPIIRSVSSSLSRPSSPSAPVIMDPIFASAKPAERRSTRRPSSTSIVEEDEKAENRWHYITRKPRQPAAVKAPDACMNGKTTTTTTTKQVSLQAIDTTVSSSRNLMMVHSSMQTDPLPGLSPLASILPSATTAKTRGSIPPITTASSMSIPTLIITTDDQQHTIDDVHHSKNMQHIGNGPELNDSDDDDDDEEWFLEDDDWDVQDQDCVMAEWLLGEI